MPGAPTVGTKFMLVFVMKCKIKIDYDVQDETSNIVMRSLMNKNTNHILGRKKNLSVHGCYDSKQLKIKPQCSIEDWLNKIRP